MLRLICVLAAAALLLWTGAPPSHAGGFFLFGNQGGHAQSDYYRGKPQVRGFRKRVGGYSYAGEDVLSSNRVRGSQGNPFDSGYFFDSNVSRYGNTSPYMN